MHRLPHGKAFLAVAALLLAACSSSDPRERTNQGTQALGAGDAKGAVEHFDAAIARLTPQDPDFLRASMGRFQALARLEPTRTKNEFLAFQAAHPDKVRDEDFKVVVDELLQRNSLTAASEIVTAGKKAFPESTTIVGLVQAVGDAAKKAKDPSAMNTMKGLGYLGDG
jgi:hypothetical protein